MMGRVSCADLAELRSAYLDGALRDADRERVLAHLVGCDPCRQEIADLRRVRELLSRREPTPAPVRLSDRLLSIPVEDRAPMRSRLAAGVPGLPDGVRKVRRRVTALVLAVGLGAAAVGGLGLAAAPAQTLSSVSDPSSEAIAEFGSVLAQLPFTNQNAAAVTKVAGSPVASVPNGRPSSAVTGSALTPEAVRTLLGQSAQADSRISYQGRLAYFATRDTERIRATLAVTNEPDHGTRITTFDTSGHTVDTQVRHPEAASRLADTAAVTLLTSGYGLTARTGAVAVGRPAVLVEARPVDSTDGQVLARWWVDADAGLVLWQETYAPSGDLLLATGFTSLRVGGVTDRGAALDVTPTVTSRTNASLTLSRADDLASAGWACTDRLAGLSLVRLRSDAAANPGVVHMVYSDGVSKVSVIEQHGRLDPPTDAVWDADLQGYVRQGSIVSVAWQSGDSVVSVVTDGSADLLHQVVAALPHEAVQTPTTMERVVAGWSRILGHR